MKAKIKKTGEVIEVSQIEDIITKRGVEHQYVDNKRSWCYYVQNVGSCRAYDNRSKKQ